MTGITANEMRFVLTILKSPEKPYNANSISRVLNISPMGAFKIAKNLEKEGVLILKELGKAKFYELNLGSDYTCQYLIFLLKREVKQSTADIRRWAHELSSIKSAEAAILFGSVLTKHHLARDTDVLLIVEKNKFGRLKKEIDRINFVSKQKLHPLYQTAEDLKMNIKKNDAVILNAVKGIVVFGEPKFISILANT